jgi:hypothetical protein
LLELHERLPGLLERDGGGRTVCQLSFCLGLALHKLFVLDFQFSQDMGFFIFWHAALPDMPRNHFRYIL